MTYRRASVIVNPKSGRHDTEKSVRAIVAGLEDAGIEPTVHITENATDPADFARRAVADGTDLVVVGGGDGTIMGAVGALAHEDVPLLPLPLGTWNGLVRMLGAPLSVGETLALCLAGEAVQIDLGYIPELERYFLLWAGAGIDAEVMANAEEGEKKKRWGYWAYLGALADRLGTSKNRRLELDLDGDKHVIDGHTVLAFNVNDLRFAGQQIGPVVDPHDGRMDVTVLTRPGPWGTLQEMVRVLRSGAAAEDALGREGTWRKASELRIAAVPALDVQADGDVVGRTPITLQVLPHALTVQAPRGYRGGRPREHAGVETSPAS